MPTTIDGSASVTINNGAVLGITSGTAVASTSGTSIDFTGIPSWVKRITVMFNGVSVSGTSRKQIQVGAGSVVTTGYVAASTYVSGTAANNTDYFVLTTGFGIIGSNAADLQSGTMILHNISGNIWVSNHSMYMTAGTLGTAAGAGNISLGGTLDRLRITTVNGTDTFDAGSINILYEG